ncbi:MAG TPA: GNAT family N-acetyltransferase [Anaeromyxobacteraceae bacterium]|nr:GNAT family N-acetyltransferase [Anaeromyxobacteraceae bacterium]
MLGFDVHVRDAIADVSALEWDRLWAHEPARATPFLQHAWLDALEQSGAVAARTGWVPRHLTLRRAGRLVAAAPAYARSDSDGDFGRDWAWAEAAARAGIPYYPKLVLGVPFAPVTGRRVLVAEGEDRIAAARALVSAARAVCQEEGLRSLHVLFPAADETAALEAAGLALRVDFQYHWVNEGYRSFDDFLSRFPSKRRNAIRRERAEPGRQGLEIRTVRGDELGDDPAGWAREVSALHRASVDRMPWGRRFVDRAFYERVFRTMPGSLEVVGAHRGARLVGMAFNAASTERLYGRYWGCREEHRFLHFNVCLYHSVEDAIRRGLLAFEPGAGGEHKLARGFEPVETWSAHAFLDPRLDVPVRRHLEMERRERSRALARWREATPVLRPVDGAG